VKHFFYKHNHSLPVKKIQFTAFNILLFTAGILLFAWFINGSGIKSLMAIAALSLPAIAVYRNVIMFGSARKIWSNSKHKWIFIAWLFIGLCIGMIAAIAYRNSIGATYLPESLTGIALVAACIGATEEILFRGVVFYLLKKCSVFISIPIAALLHASYKSLLFLSPHIQHPVDTWYLFYVTFLAGLVLGLLRNFSASTATPLVAHASWDILVYGESATAPWWVW
jgi:membrane protease YdiL (CAAX protease family)